MPRDPAVVIAAPLSPELGELAARLTDPGGPFALDELVINGVPCRAWRHQAANLRELFEASQAYGDHVYLVLGEERWTYAAHRRAVLDLVAHLRSDLGIGRGDRVAIAMRNLPEWSIAFWASAALGAVAVPLNAWWTGQELDYALRDSGSSVVICDDERYRRVAPTLAVPAVVTRRAADQPMPPGSERWDDHVGTGRGPSDLPAVAIEPDDDATLLYTSGTTGRPKGVVGSHRNICSTVVSVAYVAAWSAEVDARLEAAPRPGADKQSSASRDAPALLLAVPLFHVTGLHGALVGGLARGARVVMMHKWDPSVALDLVERERVLAFAAVPSMVRELADRAASTGQELSTLSAVTSGGAATPPDLIDRFDRRLPSTSLSTGYGLTESSALVSIIGGRDYQLHPDSVGVPIPVCDVRIVDESGQDVATGDVGQVILRGSNIVREYWNLPDVNAEAFRDGWFHTGDLGRFDADGYLYIVDRLKDLIIRGGENVSATEVESVLFRLDDVVDAAVVPVPHEVLGEEVGAVVVRRPGSSLDAAAVQTFAREHLASFKVPVHVRFSDEPLPRNPQGKILKRDLRAVFTVGREPRRAAASNRSGG